MNKPVVCYDLILPFCYMIINIIDVIELCLLMLIKYMNISKMMQEIETEEGIIENRDCYTNCSLYLFLLIVCYMLDFFFHGKKMYGSRMYRNHLIGPSTMDRWINPHVRCPYG